VDVHSYHGDVEGVVGLAAGEAGELGVDGGSEALVGDLIEFVGGD